MLISEAREDKKAIAGLNSNIGANYIKLGKFALAAAFLEKAKNLARDNGNKECLSSVYSALSELDSATGNYAAAFDNYKLYILYNDSLNNEETQNRTIQSDLNYEFDKREAIATAEHQKELEKQKSLAEIKSKKQKTILFYSAASLILILILTALVVRVLRLTRRQKTIIEQQKDLVEYQKNEAEEQKFLIEEHQREIIDSITYAKRIQLSQLPSEKYIHQALKRLNNKG